MVIKKWLIWEYLWLMVINGGVLMANSELMVINLLVMTVTVCELEHGPVEKVDLPNLKMVIFHSFLLTFTRG